MNLLRGKREEKRNKEAKLVFFLKVSGVGRKTDGTEGGAAGGGARVGTCLSDIPAWLLVSCKVHRSGHGHGL